MGARGRDPAAGDGADGRHREAGACRALRYAEGWGRALRFVVRRRQARVSARWLVLCGVVVAGLVIALIAMMHRDERPVTPTPIPMIDAAIASPALPGDQAHDAAIAIVVEASQDAAVTSALVTLRASGS